jgi:hypothetical protein
MSWNRKGDVIRKGRFIAENAKYRRRYRAQRDVERIVIWLFTILLIFFLNLSAECRVINQTSELEGAYRQFLSALAKKYRSHIIMDRNLCEGSVDIDTHLVRKYPQDNRWDYVIGYNRKAYFVEFHSAKDSEVKVVIKKLQWLKNWLTTKAPLLKALPHSLQVVSSVSRGFFEIVW